MANVRRAGTVRFTVTVEEDAFEVLEKYCDTIGATKSMVINAWLVEAADNLALALDTVEKVKSGEMPLEKLSGIVDGLEAMLSSVGNTVRGSK